MPPVQPRSKRPRVQPEDAAALQSYALAPEEDVEGGAWSVPFEDVDGRLKEVMVGLSSKEPTNALREFRELLKTDHDGRILCQYVMLSPKCVEIMSAWLLGPGSESAVPLVLLVIEMMNHPMGMLVSLHREWPWSTVKFRLDKLAHAVLSSKLKDVYAHLMSNENSRQNVALLLMASIVRRGSTFTLEAATNFDFSLSALQRLSKPSKRSEDGGKKSSTRRAFVEFSRSFIEVSHTALLRWILQIRPLCAGLLHHLASDDEMTIMGVLKTVKEKVVDASDILPAGLQSALFGDATLEQLALISCNSSQLMASQIAHDLLVLLCTDPSHGICLDQSSFGVSAIGMAGLHGGGQGRLVRLMLKLRAIENQNHRKLILLISSQRPVLAAAYFDAFPYSVEPRVSTPWFSVISLISSMISVAKVPPPFTSLAAQGLPAPDVASSFVEVIINSVLPRNLNRLVMNRCLLHEDLLVKHGCTRILLEVMAAFEFYLISIADARRASIHVVPSPIHTFSREESLLSQQWLALGKYMQDKLRAFLPDPQVIISLLSLRPSFSKDTVTRRMTIEATTSEDISVNIICDDNDIKREGSLLCDEGMVNGIHDMALEHHEVNLEYIWKSESQLIEMGDLQDPRGFLSAKLMEALASYQRIIPVSLVESFFDPFKLLPEEPQGLTLSQQQALVLLLIEVMRERSVLDKAADSEKLYHKDAYKHLNALLKLSIKSKAENARRQACYLVQSAMSSSGAFYKNESEICVWLQFLPLFNDVVIAFFCDAVNAVGRGIDKYLDKLFLAVCSTTEDGIFAFPQFGPLVICIIDKCMRVLRSTSKNMMVPQRTSIAFYVVSSLELLVQLQAKPVVLATVILDILDVGFECDQCLQTSFGPEWYPLMCLRSQMKWVLTREGSHESFFYPVPIEVNRSFRGALAKAVCLCRVDEKASKKAKASALSSCILSSCIDDVLENFMVLMELFFDVLKGKLPVLVELFAAYKWFIRALSNTWTKDFDDGLKLASSLAHSNVHNHQVQAFAFFERECGDSISSAPIQDNASDCNAPSRVPVLAFSVFLLSLPFAVIFPAVIHYFEGDRFTCILEAALFEVPPSQWSNTLCLILYWIKELSILHQNGSNVLSQLETCFFLLRTLIAPSKEKGWLSLLMDEHCTSDELCLVQDLLNQFLAHLDSNFRLAPVVSESSDLNGDCGEGPAVWELSGHEEDVELETWFDGFVAWLFRDKDALSMTDCQMIEILKVILQWASQPMDESCQNVVLDRCQVVQQATLTYCKPFLTTVMHCLMDTLLKGKSGAVNMKMQCKTIFVAAAFASYADMRLLIDVSSILLSETVECSKVNDPYFNSLHLNAGLYFASHAFDKMSHFEKQDPGMVEGRAYQIKHLKDDMQEKLYGMLVNLILARSCKRTHSCLLLALHAQCGSLLYSQLYGPSVVIMSRCIYRTSVEILKCLMLNVDRVKAVSIFLLVQASQFNLIKFAYELCCSLQLDINGYAHLAAISFWLQKGPEVNSVSITVNDMVLLLPAVNWLISIMKHDGYLPLQTMVDQVALAYFKVFKEIMDCLTSSANGIDMLNAVSRVSSNQSFQDLSEIFALTDAGHAKLMLQHCLSYYSPTRKEKDMLFSLILSRSGSLLSAGNISTCSLEAVIKLASITVAKVEMVKMLAFSVTKELDWLNGCGQAINLEVEEAQIVDHDRDYSFGVLNGLIQTLLRIFREIALLKCKDSPIDGDCRVKVQVLQFLEMTLVRNIWEVVEVVTLDSQEAQYISLFKRLTKLVLRYRFGETLSMQLLQCVACRVSQMPSYAGQYGKYVFELVVSHSSFVPLLLLASPTSKFHMYCKNYVMKDVNIRSLSSIIYLLKYPFKQELQGIPNMKYTKAESDVPEVAQVGCMECKKLELVRFLRILYNMKCEESGVEALPKPSVACSELLSLILASYGATMSIVDQETLLLMHEIEASEGAGFFGLAGMDYLWGEAGLKRRQAAMQEPEFRSGDKDVLMELHKRWFEEDMQFDPVRCGLCILFYPLRRGITNAIASPVRKFDHKECSHGILKSDEALLSEAAYDPSYILPFALHNLSSGLISVEDFIRKGLLALAFATLASAEEGMRKLGYEILAKIYTNLEGAPSFKGKPQIKLLLSFMKNSIVEPWQQLPFIIALFAADASCILMNPADVHFLTVIKFLSRTPGISPERVPLFSTMFGSGSIHFRMDRVWILRLLAFGLRTSLDTRVCKHHFILEIIMSFYSSPLGDHHTRTWALQILNRASKLRGFCQHLVENCGLLSWLFIVIFGNGATKSGEYAVGIAADLAAKALEILENALRWRSIRCWLISDGFEEIMRMSVLIKSWTRCLNHRDQKPLWKHMLKVLRIYFNISRTRKKYQRQILFSIEDLASIVRFDEIMHDGSNELNTRLLAFETIMDCIRSPSSSAQEKLMLLEIGTWAVTKVFKEVRTFYPHDTKCLKFDLGAELLEWISLSLVHGKLQQSAYSFQPANLLDVLAMNSIDTMKEVTDVNRDLLSLIINLQCCLGKWASLVYTVSVATLMVSDLDIHVAVPKQICSVVERLCREIAWPYDPEGRISNAQQSSVCESISCQILITIYQSFLQIQNHNEPFLYVKSLESDMNFLLGLEKIYNLDTHDIMQLDALKADIISMLKE